MISLQQAYENFDRSQKQQLLIWKQQNFQSYLKADGLALGKGCFDLSDTLEEAKEGVKTIMLDKKFGTAPEIRWLLKNL